MGPRALELVTRNVVPRPLEARATVAREGERWIVQLETRSHDRMGQRTLRGESCKEIQQAISLLLAMIMEAEARGEAAPPTPPPPPEPLNMSDPDEDPVTDDAPLAVPPARDRDYVLRTEGSAAVGLQPSLGLGVALSVGMAWGALEAHLGGSYWPSSRIPIFERDGVFEMRRQSAGISLCYRWLNSGRVALLSCLGPEWLWMQWRSKGLSDNDNGAVHHLMTLNGTSELRLAAVGPMFVTLTPGFTWEQRRHFTARRCEGCGPTDVFHTWDLGVRFGAGIGARF